MHRRNTTAAAQVFVKALTHYRARSHHNGICDQLLWELAHFDVTVEQFLVSSLRYSHPTQAVR